MTYQIEDGRKYLAQWDTGQRLIIDDPSITEVDFSKSRELAAPVEVITEDGLRVAKIPDVCLQQPRDLMVWFVVTDPEGRSSVVHQAAIPVLRRPKPDDYVEAEDNVLRWTALDIRISELEATGGVDVSGAQVGQTIKVSAVDDNGKPTAWEPADFPESTNDSDALEALAECGVVTPAYQDSVFYTDADGAIYVL